MDGNPLVVAAVACVRAATGFGITNSEIHRVLQVRIKGNRVRDEAANGNGTILTFHLTSSQFSISDLTSDKKYTFQVAAQVCFSCCAPMI